MVVPLVSRLVDNWVFWKVAMMEMKMDEMTADMMAVQMEIQKAVLLVAMTVALKVC